MTEKEIREKAGQALAMSEKFQERCHSAEDILVEFVYLPWWKFGERKRLRKEVCYLQSLLIIYIASKITSKQNTKEE